jgi:hypothetical protein
MPSTITWDQAKNPERRLSPRDSDANIPIWAVILILVLTRIEQIGSQEIPDQARAQLFHSLWYARNVPAVEQRCLQLLDILSYTTPY